MACELTSLEVQIKAGELRLKGKLKQWMSHRALSNHVPSTVEISVNLDYSIPKTFVSTKSEIYIQKYNYFIKLMRITFVK